MSSPSALAAAVKEVLSTAYPPGTTMADLTPEVQAAVLVAAATFAKTGRSACSRGCSPGVVRLADEPVEAPLVAADAPFSVGPFGSAVPPGADAEPCDGHAPSTS
jgi:hypothetical protein